MHHLITAARAAVLQQNWYAALTLVLTFPDVCGKMDDPDMGSTARSIAWFNDNMAPRYTQTLAQNVVQTFLNGEDCYALRCAFLHEGSLDLTNQRVRDALDNFVFITPPPNGNIMHMNTFGRQLQLQVDIFVEELCCGVESWLARTGSDTEISSRLLRLSRIYNPITKGPH